MATLSIDSVSIIPEQSSVIQVVHPQISYSLHQLVVVCQKAAYMEIHFYPPLKTYLSVGDTVVALFFALKTIHKHNNRHYETEDPFSGILRLFCRPFLYSPFSVIYAAGRVVSSATGSSVASVASRSGLYARL